MDHSALLQLNTLVLCDQPIAPVDAIYLFAQTKDNQASVLQKGLEIATHSAAPISFCGGEGAGYPGFESWKRSLLESGLAASRIFAIPAAETLNTLTEAQALVQTAQKNGWETIHIVSSPFHQLRAFMTVVGVLQRQYPELRIYNQVGKTLDWNEHVIHNQGIHKDYRKNFIMSELTRIETYHAQGNLASVTEALAYLERRRPM